MPEFRNPGTDDASPSRGVSEELITKAGRALGRIAQIQEAFRERAEAAPNADARKQLSERAGQAAAAVVREEGLSVEDYGKVLAAADNDTDVEERLLAAAQEVG